MNCDLSLTDLTSGTNSMTHMWASLITKKSHKKLLEEKRPHILAGTPNSCEWEMPMSWFIVASLPMTRFWSMTRRWLQLELTKVLAQQLSLIKPVPHNRYNLASSSWFSALTIDSTVKYSGTTIATGTSGIFSATTIAFSSQICCSTGTLRRWSLVKSAGVMMTTTWSSPSLLLFARLMISVRLWSSRTRKMSVLTCASLVHRMVTSKMSSFLCSSSLCSSITLFSRGPSRGKACLICPATWRPISMRMFVALAGSLMSSSTVSCSRKSWCKIVRNWWEGYISELLHARCSGYTRKKSRCSTYTGTTLIKRLRILVRRLLATTSTLSYTCCLCLKTSVQIRHNFCRWSTNSSAWASRLSST